MPSAPLENNTKGLSQLWDEGHFTSLQALNECHIGGWKWRSGIGRQADISIH